MAAITEKYQLKWHSFGTHIHSCVASFLSNPKFADVCLTTFDGHQILAHRFILSACSLYLHQVLKMQSKVNTSLPLLIILPPEINYKTIKILLQYMYSGEATVSKEMIDGVLRGGDLLKVQGLWRPREEEENKKLENIQERPVVPPTPAFSLPVPELIRYASARVSDKISSLQNNVSRQKNDQMEERKTNVRSETISDSEKTMNAEQPTRNVVSGKNGKGPQFDEKPSTSEIKDKDKSKEKLEYFVIKEEPIEWSEIQEGDMEMMETENELTSNEMTIKPEVFMEETDTSKSEEMYSPLTCELCSETFAVPADWVKHIQSHTDMLPAKRQRRGRSYTEDENSSFPPLHCDLCKEYFSTPAEWVRHIQNSHTEYELRASNNSNSGRPMRVSKSTTSVQKVCNTCHKKFPSHASMLIHKRTHTGEKPFMCEYCQKGFNVKSNLLRHLRTLHDRILNSTDVDHKENMSSNSSHSEEHEEESKGSS